MRACDRDECPLGIDVAFLKDAVRRICATYADKQGINHIEGHNLPVTKEIVKILRMLLEVIFPGFSEKRVLSVESAEYAIGEIVARVYIELSEQITRALRYDCRNRQCDNCDAPKMALESARRLIDRLPEIRETMKLDVAAAYDGDPAAKSFEEIILSYPGLRAISVHRVAHELYIQNIPLIPRLMSEYAHSDTGIDIHPGARIGKGFFIDHGTGVVVGETCVIGDHVKIYQGVTLGALSFPKDACGRIIRGRKRHPTIENNVTLYSGATVLGDIVIGEGSIIGGNVWVTESVAPRTLVTIAKPELNITRKAEQRPKPNETTTPPEARR